MWVPRLPCALLFSSCVRPLASLFSPCHQLCASICWVQEFLDPMDPLSTGASALAFITLAVQSAKIIFSVLSAIKDSPKHIRNVGRDVEQLGLVLSRLSKCQSLITNHNPNDPTARTIAVLLQRCSEDVSLYARRLVKWEVSPTERQTGKLWKKFLALISEKDLEAMRVAIHSHVSLLSLHLSLL